MRVPVLRAAIAGLSLAAAAPAAPPPATVATPADIYGPLYRAVALGHVQADGKSLADAVPRGDPGTIVAAYRRDPPKSRAALGAFVAANFTLPTVPPPPRPVAGTVPLARHIASLWPALLRQPAAVPAGGSALPLPAPYVVPGGRFRELYYWDSYFTMLGLAADGRDDLVESMIDDFTSLIERYGHIPNGTRTYYLSRSQPPVFALMLGLSRSRDIALFRRRLAALRAEHAYWMLGEDRATPGTALLHVVRTPDGALLNRYWDARDTPRDESYAEDIATAAAAAPGRTPAAVWRELRAGAESGWDYSSRWLADGRTLATIRTTAIAPVDLNSLLVAQETAIAAGCARIADAGCEREYRARAAARSAAIQRLMWRPRDRAFGDIEWRTGRATPALTAAASFPLFAGIATPAQARAGADTIRRRLLAPGGLRTTAIRTGQQWDAPNGWAPLQWIAIAGLRRYGEDGLARTIASRWLGTVNADYRARGILVEKYDVERGHGRASGGEYPNQQGFGWTNGVAARLIADYGVP
jgi:alpha,alpha-trehalase